MATAINGSATNNPEIDGLLGGPKWTGTITYSFPDALSDYSASYFGNGELSVSGFSSAPAQMQQAINYAVALITSYTNANIQYAGTNGADIMVAQSPVANPTSYAYYPSNVPAGGDVWFGTAYDYSLAAPGQLLLQRRRCTNSATRSVLSTARRRSAASPMSRCHRRMTISNTPS